MRGDYTILLIAKQIYFQKGDFNVRGKSSEKVIQEIIKCNIITSVEEALNIGRELAKAEQALKEGRGYEQQ